MLGIKWGCEHYRPYVLGSRFTVFTDHKNLTGMLNSRQQNRMAGWAFKLAEYNYKVEYWRGVDNIADSFSRYPLEASKDIEIDTHVIMSSEQEVMNEKENEQKKY